MKRNQSCILKGRLTAAYLENGSQLLKMLAHPQRLKLVEILKREEEVSVHQLIDELGIPQTAVPRI